VPAQRRALLEPSDARRDRSRARPLRRTEGRLPGSNEIAFHQPLTVSLRSGTVDATGPYISHARSRFDPSPASRDALVISSLALLQPLLVHAFSDVSERSPLARKTCGQAALGCYESRAVVAVDRASWSAAAAGCGGPTCRASTRTRAPRSSHPASGSAGGPRAA